MANSIRIALPGYNAQTDSDPDHFALDATDEESVLIKEKVRGSVAIASGNTQTIAHNLGYIPFFSAFIYEPLGLPFIGKPGYIPCSSGGSISVPTYDAHVDSTNLYLTNNSGATVTFWYYLFYDQQL